MIIPIIGRSAAEFWLGPSSAIYTNFSFNVHKELVSFPATYNYSLNATEGRYLVGLLGLNLPIETFSFSHKHHQQGKTWHVLTRYKPFPENTFVYFKLDKNIITVACPELCFLQSAKALDIPHLVLLGTQLCALYYTQPEIRADLKSIGGKTTVQKDRAPLTTEKQLAHFLENAAGEFGIKTARIALRYIIGESNSPMETALAVLMILPIEYGGYGLPRFTLNYPLPLSQEASAYYGYDVLRGDFCWADQKIVAEYNSKSYHLDPKQQAIDARRVNALQLSGYKVVPITFNNLKYFSDVENTMSLLMDSLGRPDLKIRLQENREMRKQLCHELLGTDSDFYERFHK